MRRRDFITFLGGAAVAGPLTARARQPKQMRNIGVLMAYANGDREGKVWIAKLHEGLRKLGWVEGRDIQVTYGWGGDAESRQRISKEFVAAQLDLVLTQNTPTTEAMVRETRTIPIIFANVSDPVGSGFVASFSRPSGNVTGFVNFESSLGGKWLELLKEIASRIDHVAFLFNPVTAPFSGYYLNSFRAAGQSFKVETITAPVRNVGELESTVATLARERDGGGLIVMPETFLNIHRTEVLSLASRYRLPAVYPYRFFAKLGGLLSYGSDPRHNFQRAATYVDRVLKGEKPADLPVQAPTQYELLINLKTAKALGLTVPPMLLAQADEVIE